MEMGYVYIGLAFGAGFLMVFGVNLLLADVIEGQRQRARKRLDEEMRLRQRERARGSLEHKELYELAAGHLVGPPIGLAMKYGLKRLLA